MNKKVAMALALTTGALFMASCSAAPDTPAAPTPSYEINVNLNAGAQNGDSQNAINPDNITTAPTQTPVGAAPTEVAEITEVNATAGIFKEITDEFGEKQVYLEIPQEGGPTGELFCTILPETIVVDAKSGEKLSLDSLKAGDAVLAYTGLQMARSIPPQANLYALITNLPDSLTGIPTYIQAYSVTNTEDGGLAVVNANQDLIVTVPVDMAAAIPLFGNSTVKADAQDITAGSKMLMWFDAVMPSLPAQATAEKVMLIQE